MRCFNLEVNMRAFVEYDQYDGIGLAGLIKSGEVEAAEVCEEAIRRAEASNSKLNAIITPLYDYARKASVNLPVSGTFHGVPFLLKDAHHALEGAAISSGSALLKQYVSQTDSEIVRRFKQCGLVILGKTNTPEFKLSYVTEPRAFGITRNPWNLEFTPGGSSGGSAAAVAARIVPIASGTDEGGSIRVPASCCGLFGLKPSRGRNPVGPDFDLEWDGMSTSHVITRSVRDSAAALDATAGYEIGAPFWSPPHHRPFIEEVNIDPKPLSIGFHTHSAFGREVHADCKEAVIKTCTLLNELGHQVEEIVPGYKEEEMALDWFIVLLGNFAAHVEKLISVYGRHAVKRNLELMNYTLFKLGSALKAVDFITAKRKWRTYGYIMGQTLQKYDLILTPTLGEPPIPVGTLVPSKSDQRSMKLVSSEVGKLFTATRKMTLSLLEEIIQKMMKPQMPFTLIANITGQPAMSVPLYWTENGLPCGVQFLARIGDEAALLRMAGQLEKAKPWADKKPRNL
jgi:amidase